MTTKVITSLIAGIGIGVAGWSVLPACAETPDAVSAPIVDAPVVEKDQGYLPFGGAPINYRSENLDDPIARLQSRLDRGDVQLKYDGKHGYLKSVLDLLHVSITSQTLVFSKTSFQYPQISPEHPRALYFNDDVYVGQVHEGKSLEFVSFDPMQGAIFYVLDEHQVEHPRFERAELDCIQCHVGTSTQKVPGVMLRSVYPSASGTQAGGTPSYITGHESPIQERWCGWFVTGTHGKQTHMGNTVLPADAPIQQLDRSTNANKTSLQGSLDTSQYLAPTSDIVAHLVLTHQTQMHNYITQANYQTRLALYADAQKIEKGTLAAGDTSDAAKQQIRKAVEPLVRYILFANEAPLEDAIAGTAGYRLRSGNSMRLTRILSAAAIALLAFGAAASAQTESQWTDPATKLTWTLSDSGSPVTYSQARYYCANLSIGGHKDWQLPSIDQLQKIFGGPANARGHHLVGPLQLTGWQWSSTPGKEKGEAWGLDFGDGARSSLVMGDSGLNRALCVRR